MDRYIQDVQLSYVVYVSSQGFGYCQYMCCDIQEIYQPLSFGEPLYGYEF